MAPRPISPPQIKKRLTPLRRQLVVSFLERQIDPENPDIPNLRNFLKTNRQNISEPDILDWLRKIKFQREVPATPVAPPSTDPGHRQEILFHGLRDRLLDLVGQQKVVFWFSEVNRIEWTYTVQNPPDVVEADAGLNGVYAQDADNPGYDNNPEIFVLSP